MVLVFSGAKDKLAVLNPLQGSDCRGERSELSGMTAEQDHLETCVVRDVHVRCRDDRCMVIVLHLPETRGEVTFVVVVDEGQDAERVRELIPHLFIHKPRADEVAERLRPGGIAVLLQEPVEPADQGALDGDAEAGQGRHGVARISKKVALRPIKINGSGGLASRLQKDRHPTF